MSQSKDNDEIKEQVDKYKEKYKNNNGQILLNFVDKNDDAKKLALYKYNHTEKMPSDLTDTILGKRGTNLKELKQAT